MTDQLDSISKALEAMALEVVNLEEGDIPGLGKTMNMVSDLEKLISGLPEPAFTKVLEAVKGYVEKLILAEEQDTSPLAEGVSTLQAIFRAMTREEPFEGDISKVLSRLGQSGQGSELPGEEAVSESEVEDEPSEGQPEGAKGNSTSELNEEDREVMADFVVEALENLASIEVNLIELEQDPEDADTINAIFRPFHTIKGVSGFLNLHEINKLSHSAESLLDMARSGQLAIDGTIVDIILESVDLLKQMIEGVKQALESGQRPVCEHDIEPLVKRIQDIINRSEELKDKPLGEVLVQKGAVDKEKIKEILEEQKQQPNKKVGEILVEKGIVESKEVITALREQKRVRKKVDLQVKVDTKKLDTLVDMTGELVIAQSILRQNETIVSVSDQKLYHALNQLHQISSTLQKTAMAMRMVPIRSTFQKMFRLVRDLSRHSGKKVSLKMFGEDTEIDRNVVEELYEPMVHMIRNAVDHGIEEPEERKKAGKSEQGLIELRAYQRGSSIMIEIADDGKGLDRERILQKAISKGLVSEDNQLTDQEIYNLIFRPGFSTAEVVTDISGRGVGMDVVKKAIEKLRGRVEIQSTPGKGSTFVISLPLTLAIIDGIIVKVGGERYIIPALGILKSFKPQPSDYSTVEGRGEMLMVRGELIRLVRLDQIFGLSESMKSPWESLAVVVEYEGEKLCLLVDDLLGKEEVVIKSLGEGLKNVQGLAGGAILGDGRVGLILDIAGLFQMARDNGRQKNHALERVA